jgi:hypothetical protein
MALAAMVPVPTASAAPSTDGVARAALTVAQEACHVPPQSQCRLEALAAMGLAAMASVRTASAALSTDGAARAVPTVLELRLRVQLRRQFRHQFQRLVVADAVLAGSWPVGRPTPRMHHAAETAPTMTPTPTVPNVPCTVLARTLVILPTLVTSPSTMSRATTSLHSLASMGTTQPMEERRFRSWPVAKPSPPSLPTLVATMTVMVAARAMPG